MSEEQRDIMIAGAHAIAAISPYSSEEALDIVEAIVQCRPSSQVAALLRHAPCDTVRLEWTGYHTWRMLVKAGDE